MNCITSSFRPPLLRSHLRPNRRQRQQNSPSLLPTLHSFRQNFISPQRQRFASLKGMAIPSSLILAAGTPPAQSGDVTVLLQTGGVLLIAYFIANFIVPEFIMKSHRSDESEEQKSDEKARGEDEETGASGRKKQGFSGNKR